MSVHILVPLFVFATVVGLQGGALSAISAGELISYLRKKRRCSRRTMASVTDIERKSSGKKPVWDVTYSYRADDIPMRRTDRLQHPYPFYKRGQTVSLFYNPAKPSELLLEDNNFLCGNIIWLLAGIALLISSFGIVAICAVWPL